MIQKLLKNPFNQSRATESVAEAALIISVAGIVSRVLGLVRDRILAARFGAGETLDVYYAAFRIPDMLYSLLILGALSAAFIPIFSGLMAKKKNEEAWRLAASVLNLVVLAIGVLSVIFVIFAPWIMRIITPGFTPENLQLAVKFTRLMFFSPLLLGASAVFNGILVSKKRFLISSLAPSFYNLGIIVGATLLVDWLGPVGLAWGVAGGALLHLLVQYQAARPLGFHFHWGLRDSIFNPEVRQVVHLMIPRTLGVAMTQINLFVVTFFASSLAVGSLAVFNFANNLQSVPLGLIGIPFSLAVFPTLSVLAAQDERRGFVFELSKTARKILFFVLPFSAFLIVLRAQIVRVVLGAGQFGWDDTIRTFQVLGVLALSLFAQCLVPLFARAFYALHDTKTPLFAALISELVNIVTILALIGKWQLFGIAIAFSLSTATNILILFIVLRIKLGRMDARRILTSLGKITLASMGAAGAAQAGKVFASMILSTSAIDTFVEIFSQLIFAGFAGIAVFFVLCYLLNIEEFHELRKSINLRFSPKVSPLTEDQHMPE